MPQSNQPSLDPAEPDLATIVRGWWRLRRWIFAGALVGLVAAFLFLAVAVPHYRVSMLVAPADRGAGMDIKALLPDSTSFALQYLASSIGTRDTTDFSRFETIVRGTDVAAVLIKNEKVTEHIGAARPVVLVPGAHVRTGPELAAWMARHVRVEPVGVTTMRRIVLNHPDPDWAAAFLVAAHSAADQLIRNDVRSRADVRSVYLRDALRRTDHPDHRRALTGLLMEQEHVRMMLAMDEPFAAVVAEGAAASARPVWPRKALVFPAFILAGAVLFYGAGLVFGAVPGRRD